MWYIRHMTDTVAELTAKVDDSLAFMEVAHRVSYDLDYRRVETPRKFVQNGIVGKTIDNARDPVGERVTGRFTTLWDKTYQKARSREEWLRLFFVAVLQEAGHEAMEWFQLDGVPLVDPHSHEFGAEIEKLADALLSHVDLTDLLQNGNHPTEWKVGLEKTESEYLEYVQRNT